MPEFFNVLPPDDARALLFDHLTAVLPSETIKTENALGRVLETAVFAPHALPQFRRSTMDGYAVRAADTFGASESLPAFLQVVGEVPMGKAADVQFGTGQAVIVHTGGMIPAAADAVVQIEHTQVISTGISTQRRGGAEGETFQENVSKAEDGFGEEIDFEIEVFKSVAVGQNVLQVGEDVAEQAEILPVGHLLRPQDLGGLLALGITEITVTRPTAYRHFSDGG